MVALLARGTSTAGELSEIANVPRSRAYDILQSLAEKGFVVLQTAKPMKYVAIAPAEAFERAKSKLEAELKEMQERMGELKSSPVIKELNDIFNKGMKIVEPEDMTGALKGRHLVSQQISTMFRGANKKISIVTSADGLNDLAENHTDVLKKANGSGVDIRIVTGDANKCTDAIKSLSGVADVRELGKQVPMGGRFVVVDGKQLVLGLTDFKSVHDTQHTAVWSSSEHAASDVLEPLFELVWNNSKPVG
jgi:HTH-type transcriptional regulator, sugar sensing transcriptional regulator